MSSYLNIYSQTTQNFLLVYLCGLATVIQNSLAIAEVIDEIYVLWSWKSIGTCSVF